MIRDPWKPMVLVRWIDSSHTSGWTAPADHKPAAIEDLECETAGFLYEETDHSVSIVQSLGDEKGQYDGIMTIPRVAILHIVRLSYAPVEKSRRKVLTRTRTKRI